MELDGLELYLLVCSSPNQQQQIVPFLAATCESYGP